MTRRIRRHKAFDITVQIKDAGFLRTPRDDQRNWVLNRAIKEFEDDLIALDASARRFVRGGEPIPLNDRSQAALSDPDIMEDWQTPVMQAMARAVTDTHGDVLEIGFGRGLASTMIQECGVRSHTIVECNRHVMAESQRWQANFPQSDIRLIEGMWQDVAEKLDSYDGIFFHTYPLNESEMLEQKKNQTLRS